MSDKIVEEKEIAEISEKLNDVFKECMEKYNPVEMACAFQNKTCQILLCVTTDEMAISLVDDMKKCIDTYLAKRLS